MLTSSLKSLTTVMTIVVDVVEVVDSVDVVVSGTVVVVSPTTVVDDNAASSSADGTTTGATVADGGTGTGGAVVTGGVAVVGTVVGGAVGATVGGATVAAIVVVVRFGSTGTSCASTVDGRPSATKPSTGRSQRTTCRRRDGEARRTIERDQWRQHRPIAADMLPGWSRGTAGPSFEKPRFVTRRPVASRP